MPTIDGANPRVVQIGGYSTTRGVSTGFADCEATLSPLTGAVRPTDGPRANSAKDMPDYVSLYSNGLPGDRGH